MFEFSIKLLGPRVFVSLIGLVGNILLIVFIIQTKSSHVKSFELFLLGLAAANLEEIVIINIYIVIVLRTSAGTWWCRLFKFLTIFGEMASILFTVVICIYRYQKLRDAKRVNLPICLDGVRAAWMLSGVCVTLSALIGLPIFAITLQGSVENGTENSGGCPPDFFNCDKNNCPPLNLVYKYLFLLICYLLPLIIVTVSSCLIVIVLLNQEKAVIPVDDGCPDQHGKKIHSHSHSHSHNLHRSTVAVVAAMWLFQVDWTLYLICQWTLSPNEIPFWLEIEFFISTSYTSISPYVYGIGNHLFSIKNFKALFKL
ncbi:trissin receptor [Kryptolebias marmoratus]|uniref:trissin receptor n=1 Tax=Kryptolebias marmoratus TaxID=37003 RepID=UPI0007F9290A|nr:trissin receptor [Kryptolebias marmoratus]